MSSLLEQASICITPNAYKEGKLYGLKGTDLDVVRATTATRVNESGLIESVANNVPRLDYTGGSCPSILVEPQRTNLALYSEEFDNASWTKISSIITNNTTIAPNGTLTADKSILNVGVNPLVGNATGVSQIQTVTSGVYTYSIFAKAGERNIIRWRDGGFSGQYLVVNLSNGTFTNGAPTRFVNPQVISYANGWYRIIFTTGTITNPSVYPLRFGDTGETGDGVSGGFIWGAQLEVGSNATSYIPTVASAVTRNADVISKTGIADLIGQTEGTLFVEFDMTQTSETHTPISISDGTSTSNFVLVYKLNNNTLSARIRVGGVDQPLINSAILASGRHKFAFAYKQNDLAFYVDGVLAGTSSSANIPAVLSKLSLNDIGVGVNQMFGGTRQALLFKTRLDNATLATLTTL